MNVINHVWDALHESAAMGWQILWPLVLGFALSGAIQAVVSHDQMGRLLPDARPKTLLKATGLGAAASSCSYAAAALGRSLFQKGANFTASMAFVIASTNLVVEIGVIMLLILGWQFTLAEFIGGPVMIIVMALLFRLVLRPRMVEAARKQAQKGLVGKMEGHASMHDMSVRGDASLLKKIISKDGRTAISHYFVMDWASVWVDIAVGLVIAGALSAWVPDHWWQALFFSDHETFSKFWGPLIGPVIAMLSFVCSVGNIPLAAVLWNGGLSFGGVVSFIFADLIIIPIIRIHGKYYGHKVSLLLLGVFYAAMIVAGYLVEIFFALLRITPTGHVDHAVHAGFSWNYTTWLNVVFLVMAAALVWRFLRTGGPDMLRMMNSDGGHDHAHMHHDHGQVENGTHGHGDEHHAHQHEANGQDAHDHHEGHEHHDGHHHRDQGGHR